MYRTHDYCRACGYAKPNTPPGIKATNSGDKLIEVFDLGVQPLANDFTKLGDEHKGYAPLKVLFCPKCTLAQLSVVVKPEVLYCNYPYVTSRSQTMLEHFRLLWSSIRAECTPESVVEIGSNDGHFLKFCKENGAEAVIGIDPAENLKPGDDTGVMSLCGVFDEATAETAKAAMPPVDVIVARHVFAHIDNWRDFVRNLDILANKNTLVVIECPYVGDLLDGLEFDTIYHEHLSYISLKSIEKLLYGTVFHLHKVQKVGIHGGAIVMMIRRNDCDADPCPSVDQFLDLEHVDLSDWQKFSNESRRKMIEMSATVTREVLKGKTVVGFGASAKSTVWISACRFGRREVSYICDSTRQKWGGMSPGSDIPIVDEAALLRERPDYAICFAWNFLPEILKSQSRYVELGGKFIVPVPDIRVVP